jgi:hypothetical protein
MPVLVMWAVPAVIVIGGVGYFLVRPGRTQSMILKFKTDHSQNQTSCPPI